MKPSEEIREIATYYKKHYANQYIGQLMKHLRQEQGLGLEVFAVVAGMRPNVLESFEKGSYVWSEETIYKTLTALNEYQFYHIGDE
jgi:transcriptional regulator with XRE-family HTH domain